MKRFKFLAIILTVVFCFSLTACNDDKPTDWSSVKTLVAYFSCTNHTENIANYISEITGSTLYKITPAVPYTSADINHNNETCRANIEQNDENCRPEISGSVENMQDYDVVFVGYPIWWGQAPKIIYTFIEKYKTQLEGKTIIPFCTSGSSPIGTSASNIHNSAPLAKWDDGMRFASSATKSSVNDWISALVLSL